MMGKAEKASFSNYQILVIAILAILQFTVVLDFMVLSPLGAQLMLELNISPRQFGWVVSAYAFSAGLSGLLAAGFADKFDRKKLLIFFYSGFILGTFLCGIAPNYQFLLYARIITGMFGGVMVAIVYTIITDLFVIQTRGRVMGFVQMAFATSQILGIPVGLYLAKQWGWHSPFQMIVGLSVLVILVIIFYIKPIDAHLNKQVTTNPLRHLYNTVSRRYYLKGFGAIALLATGGFMLMPFASAFIVYNLGLSLDHLPLIYLITGISSMIAGPLIGKLSDQIGKYKVFFYSSSILMVLLIWYCNLGTTPLWIVIIANAIMFVSVTGRIISASAIMTAVPDLADRGAFMSIQSAVQHISGGFATAIAGMIVVQTSSGSLQNYDLLGYVVILATMITMSMMYVIHKSIQQKSFAHIPQVELVPVAEKER